MSDVNNKPTHKAYVNLAKDGAEKSYFREIGAVWKHKSGDGFSLKLDLLPAQGQDIVVFANKPKEQ